MSPRPTDLIIEVSSRSLKIYQKGVAYGRCSNLLERVFKVKINLSKDVSIFVIDPS